MEFASSQVRLTHPKRPIAYNVNVSVRANSDIPMLFTRLASLRDDQDRREVTCAKNLPRYSPAAA
jgi:hypothetical protein